MIRYLLLRACTMLWQRLPLRLGYAIAVLLGDLAYCAWPRGRRYAKENMARVLGNGVDRKTISRFARQSLRNYCKYLVDFMRFPLLGPGEINEAVVFSGWDSIDRAFAEGKGVILVGMHLGNWDLGAAHLAVHNYPVNVIAETFTPPQLNHWVQGARTKLGMKVIPMEDAVRPVIRALRRNEMVMLLIDQPDNESGVAVEFFQSPTKVPAGAALLSLRTGAKVVPGAMVRLGNNRFLGFTEPHINFEPTGDLGRDVETLTQHIVSAIENWVRRYPDQWYMFRPMWV